MTDILFLFIIFLTAILYSSVGQGGASGYLAVMAVFNFPHLVMRPTALLLNVFISAISFFFFYRNKHFRFKLLWPFIVTSVPFAFLGGSQVIDEKKYKIILGVFLVFAVSRMLFKTIKAKNGSKQVHVPAALIIGALLGYFSGLIGIGGGIVLSPIIIIFAWGSQKETAAVAAAFVFVNSVSGLGGLLIHHAVDFNSNMLYIIIAGILGGIVGAYLGSTRLPENILKFALSLVLLFASMKLFFMN